MFAPFHDRAEAGRLLATKLAKYDRREDVLVLALPRGGVPVGYEVARALHAPLDVMVVRKLGLPANEELAMGAIASGGWSVLNAAVVAAHAIPRNIIESVTVREERELERRERAYRHGWPAPALHGRIVILVDDGIATGSTMCVAVAALRDAGAGRVVIAAPVAARDSYLELRRAASEVAVVALPKDFESVGRYYEDFSQTSDGEVGRLLEVARVQLAADSAGSHQDQTAAASASPLEASSARRKSPTGANQPNTSEAAAAASRPTL
jgi:predicted phosphoribosyltransferase